MSKWWRIFYGDCVFAFSVIWGGGTNDYVFLILRLSGRSSRASLHWGVHIVSGYCFWRFAYLQVAVGLKYKKIPTNFMRKVGGALGYVKLFFTDVELCGFVFCDDN